MHVSRTYATLVLALSFSALTVPCRHAAAAESSSVNVGNFPETQQIKGDVQVTNFPATQQVRGSVAIDGATKYFTKESILVPPSQRADPDQMVYAGTIDTDGYTSLLAAVQGEMRSDVFSPGTIGVLLVPDEKPILHVLRDTKRVQYPIECTAQTRSGDSIYFESRQVQDRIAFPRYKIFLYNSTNKQAEANIYFYLSNAPTVVVQELSNKEAGKRAEGR